LLRLRAPSAAHAIPGRWPQETTPRRQGRGPTVRRASCGAPAEDGVGDLIRERFAVFRQRGFGGFDVAGEVGLGRPDGGFGAMPGVGDLRRFPILKLFAPLLLLLINLRTRGAKGRLILGGFGGGPGEALFGCFTRALGGVVALAKDL